MAFVLVSSQVPNVLGITNALKVPYALAPGLFSYDEIDHFFSSTNLLTVKTFALLYENSSEQRIPLFAKQAERVFSTELRYFLNKLKLFGIETLDLITCNINEPSIIDEIHEVEADTGLVIRYSIDETGMQDGDWILESHNVDIQDFYFNDSISLYHNVLWHVSGMFVNNPVFDYDGNIVEPTDINNNPLYNNGFESYTHPITGLTFIRRKVFNPSSVTTWGNYSLGANTLALSPSSLTLSNVISICSSRDAFAALRDDGKVVCWGSSAAGGNVDTPAGNGYGNAQSLINVVSIFATNTAFAALRSDGTVRVWGSVSAGGNPVNSLSPGYSPSQNIADVTNIKTVFASQTAFAAYSTNFDGSVYTWGAATGGAYSKPGSTISAPNGLWPNTGNVESYVKSVYCINAGFAALKQDRRVFCWGSSGVLGNAMSTRLNTLNTTPAVKMIYGSTTAFCAVRTNNTIGESFGAFGSGGTNPINLPPVASGRYVVSITPGNQAFAAKFDDGSVWAWGSNSTGGYTTLGGNITSIYSIPWNPTKIYNNNGSFAAIYSDSTNVAVWGDVNYGGETLYQPDASPADTYPRNNVIKLIPSQRAYAAVNSSGGVFTWGDTLYGGNVTYFAHDENGTLIDVSSQLTSGVQYIFASEGTFAALKSDGTVVSWAESSITGVQKYKPDNLTNVQTIYSTGSVSLGTPNFAFAALVSNTPIGNIPGPVQSLTASTTTTTFILNWLAPLVHPESVSSYKIYNVSNVEIASISSSLLTYTVTGLTPDTSYTYRVAAASSSGTSSLESVTASTSIPTPGVPTSLTATPTTTTMVLNWGVPATNPEYVSTYKVYDASDTLIASTASLTYTVTGLSPSTSYTFKVSAANANGDESAKASVTQSTNANVEPGTNSIVISDISGLGIMECTPS